MDEKERLVEQRSRNKWLLAILLFAAKLDQATRSPLTSTFVWQMDM